MRAGTRLFGSTFTDLYLQFQKSQKVNFSFFIYSTFGMPHISHAKKIVILHCGGFINPKVATFLCENIIWVNLDCV